MSRSDMENGNPHQASIAAIDSLAVSPCDANSVPRLVQDLASKAQSYSDNSSRLQLLNTARSLVRALETPRETVIRLCWAEVCSSLGMLVHPYEHIE